MRDILKIASVLILLALGCVPSLYPLYNDSDLIQKPGLIGTWINDDNTEIWEFSLASDSVSYNLSQTTKGDTKRFEAYLLQLDKILYVDTYPVDEFKNDFYQLHFVPAHIFGKAELSGDSLSLSLFDGDWLREKIDSGYIKIAHEDVDNSLILTAQTADLQRLIRVDAKDDPGAFGSPTILHRKLH